MLNRMSDGKPFFKAVARVVTASAYCRFCAEMDLDGASLLSRDMWDHAHGLTQADAMSMTGFKNAGGRTNPARLVAVLSGMGPLTHDPDGRFVPPPLSACGKQLIRTFSDAKLNP